MQTFESSKATSILAFENERTKVFAHHDTHTLTSHLVFHPENVYRDGWLHQYVFLNRQDIRMVLTDVFAVPSSGSSRPSETLQRCSSDTEDNYQAFVFSYLGGRETPELAAAFDLQQYVRGSALSEHLFALSVTFAQSILTDLPRLDTLLKRLTHQLIHSVFGCLHGIEHGNQLDIRLSVDALVHDFAAGLVRIETGLLRLHKLAMTHLPGISLSKLHSYGGVSLRSEVDDLIDRIPISNCKQVNPKKLCVIPEFSLKIDGSFASSLTKILAEYDDLEAVTPSTFMLDLMHHQDNTAIAESQSFSPEFLETSADFLSVASSGSLAQLSQGCKVGYRKNTIANSPFNPHNLSQCEYEDEILYRDLSDLHVTEETDPVTAQSSLILDEARVLHVSNEDWFTTSRFVHTRRQLDELCSDVLANRLFSVESPYVTMNNIGKISMIDTLWPTVLSPKYFDILSRATIVSAYIEYRFALDKGPSSSQAPLEAYNSPMRKTPCSSATSLSGIYSLGNDRQDGAIFADEPPIMRTSPVLRYSASEFADAQSDSLFSVLLSTRVRRYTEAQIANVLANINLAYGSARALVATVVNNMCTHKFRVAIFGPIVAAESFMKTVLTLLPAGMNLSCGVLDYVYLYRSDNESCERCVCQSHTISLRVDELAISSTLFVNADADLPIEQLHYAPNQYTQCTDQCSYDPLTMVCLKCHRLVSRPRLLPYDLTCIGSDPVSYYPHLLQAVINTKSPILIVDLTQRTWQFNNAERHEPTNRNPNVPTSRKQPRSSAKNPYHSDSHKHREGSADSDARITSHSKGIECMYDLSHIVYSINLTTIELLRKKFGSLTHMLKSFIACTSDRELNLPDSLITSDVLAAMMKSDETGRSSQDSYDDRTSHKSDDTTFSATNIQQLTDAFVSSIFPLSGRLSILKRSPCYTDFLSIFCSPLSKCYSIFGIDTRKTSNALFIQITGLIRSLSYSSVSIQYPSLLAPALTHRSIEYLKTLACDVEAVITSELDSLQSYNCTTDVISSVTDHKSFNCTRSVHRYNELCSARMATIMTLRSKVFGELMQEVSTGYINMRKQPVVYPFEPLVWYILYNGFLTFDQSFLPTTLCEVDLINRIDRLLAAGDTRTFVVRFRSIRTFISTDIYPIGLSYSISYNEAPTVSLSLIQCFTNRIMLLALMRMYYSTQQKH